MPRDTSASSDKHRAWLESVLEGHDDKLVQLTGYSPMRGLLLDDTLGVVGRMKIMVDKHEKLYAKGNRIYWLLIGTLAASVVSPHADSIYRWLLERASR